MSKKNLDHIPQEKFQFVQLDATLHDKRLETKPRGFFADAFLRFKKNKSSVVASWILLFLMLYALIVPMFSDYDIKDQYDNDRVYTNYPAFVRDIAEKGWGFMDGSHTAPCPNDRAYQKLEAIGVETGMNPILEIVGTTQTESLYRGQIRVDTSYTLRLNKYYEYGICLRVFSYEEFQQIMDWQNETGIQVIYPYVESKDIKDIDLQTNPNVWFQVKDNKGTPKLDEEGNFIPAYSTNKEIEGMEYTSIRIAGDDGSYIYSAAKSGSVQARVCYFNYYQFLNGHEPNYILGTNSLGMDLFTAIAVGARFSIIFAIIVSAINLSIGAIYGAIQGYYGGAIDMVLDRISDILSGVPFIVCATLFQYHFAGKVHPVVSFLFAFVLTGWIGMSALVRKQFYRFKGQEFVLAARTLGASDGRLMFKHVFPNAMGTIITSCALVIPSVISSETSLTYLGIVNLADLAGTTIGTLLSTAQTSMTSAPHAMLWPSVFFSLMLISFNLFGNGLRDAFNPSTRGAED